MPRSLRSRAAWPTFRRNAKNVWSHLAGIWTQPAGVCPAYLPPGCHIHGNVTSNNVESFNYMAM
eukprot:3791035-Pleurochrysis_carterae.AAC.1